MAEREGLRALQNRLAQSLTVNAASSGGDTRWLAVMMGGRKFLIPLDQAGEIFAWQQPAALAYTQPWFLGVANLRGRLVGVVDVAQFMGDAQERSEQQLQQARIVTVHPAYEVNAGIVVDQLLGLRSGKDWASRIEPNPPSGLAYWGACYEDTQGQKWQELLVGMLVAAPSFLDIRL